MRHGRFRLSMAFCENRFPLFGNQALDAATPSAQALRPPVRKFGAQGFRRGARIRGGSEQAEARCARARHARQLAAGKPAQDCEHLGDHRLQARSPALRDRSAAVQHPQQLAGTRQIRQRPSHRIARPVAPLIATRFQPAKTCLVATATPGLTNTAGSCGSGKRRRKPFADAAHQARARIEANRHVGAGRARRRLQSADRPAQAHWPGRSGAAPQRRRTSRRRARRRPADSFRGETRPGRARAYAPRARAPP